MSRCNDKGHVIPDDAPHGLCPRCLFDLEVLAFMPDRIGAYEILEPLGEGGFGRVYRARHTESGQLVAIKVLRDREFSDEATIAQFRKEPSLSAKLRADYVVPVLATGEHEGLPYFVMEYMPGGTLRERLHRYEGAPRRAAALMIRIAEAVEYLHSGSERPARDPILHRDLKPENILFDADDNPRISDFGIAKLTKGTTWTRGSRIVGCPAYIAPEQAYPSPHQELTASADVYALGAMLYELFTGQPPFDGTDTEIMRQLENDEPIRPRRLAPALDRFLEAAVMSALEKDPTVRYASAAGFARDLERALQWKPGENTPNVALSTRVRARLRQKPLTTAACAWILSLSVVVGVSAHLTLAARSDALARDQQTNAAVGGMHAVAVNLQLRAFERRIAELAQDPEVVALLDATTPRGDTPTLRKRLDPFGSMFVLAPDGRPRGRSSFKPALYLERSFSFRDYFIGARRLGAEICSDEAASRRQRAHLARAFISEADGRFEFAVSAPICRENQWAGAIVGTIVSDKMLGAVRVLDDRNERVAAVLGPRDREREETGPLPSDLHFVVHPGLDHGDGHKLRDPSPVALRTALGLASPSEQRHVVDASKLRYAAPFRVDDYRDPIAGFEGAWSATFTTADESGFVVVVQSRRDVTPLVQVLLQKLALPAGVPFGVALLVLSAIALTRRRVRRVRTLGFAARVH